MSAPDVTSVARLSEATEKGKGALKCRIISLRNLFQNVMMIQYDNFTYHDDLSSEYNHQFPLTYKRCF